MKKCTKCGRECLDSDRFCLNCGTPIPETQQTEAPAQKVEAQAAPVQKEAQSQPVAAPAKAAEPKKASGGIPKFLIPIAAAAVVLIVVIICICVSSGSVKISKKAWLSTAFSNKEDCNIFFSLDGKVVPLDEDIRVSYEQCSADMSVCCFIDSADDNTLYLVEKDGIKEIANEVKGVTVSVEGNTIAYVNEVEDGAGTLYLYNVKKGKSEKIAEDVRDNGFVLSPSGETIAYVGDYDEESGDYRGFKSVKGKKPVEIGKNYAPVGISDNGKLVYYTRKDGYECDFYVMKGEDTNKLVADFAGDVVYFNEDLSQVIFIDEGKTYYSEDGGEKTKIGSDSLQWFIRYDELVTAQLTGLDVDGIVYMKDSFEGSACIMDGSMYFIKDKFEAEKITSSYSDYEISADGESMLYVKNDDLYYIKNMNKSLEGECIGEELEIMSLYACEDLSHIYYLDRDETLYYKKGSKKQEKISDDVYSMLTMDRDDDTIYFFVDYDTDDGIGDLSMSDAGGKKKAVKGAKEVSQIGSYLNMPIYFTESAKSDGSDVYIARSGSSFKLFLEGIRD